MAESDNSGTGGNGAESSGSDISNLRDRQTAYLPVGYELVPERDTKRLKLLRPDGSEVRSFDRAEIKEAERVAFEDVRKRRRREDPL